MTTSQFFFRDLRAGVSRLLERPSADSEVLVSKRPFAANTVCQIMEHLSNAVLV